MCLLSVPTKVSFPTPQRGRGCKLLAPTLTPAGHPAPRLVLRVLGTWGCLSRVGQLKGKEMRVERQEQVIWGEGQVAIIVQVRKSSSGQSQATVHSPQAKVKSVQQASWCSKDGHDQHLMTVSPWPTPCQPLASEAFCVTPDAP